MKNHTRSNVHGGDNARPAADSSFVSRFGGTLKGRSGKKARAALALAVSLWMASGGVASAGQTTTVETDHTGEVNGNHVGNDLRDRSGDPNGNTVTVNESVTVTGNVYGAYYFNIDGNVTNNTVTVNGKVTKAVYGGCSGRSFDVTGNHVAVTGTVGENVYGGWTGGGVRSGTATGNSVTVNGGTISTNVYGGYSTQGSATGNTVTLNNATIASDVYGGYKSNGTGDVITGNTLNLSGVNTVDGTVGNFETIQFDSEKLAWDTTKTVLTAQKFDNAGKLDVSAVTGKATTPGAMTLLKATGSNLPAFALSTGGEITTAGVKVVNEAKTDGAGGVTIGYNNTHTVALANTNKAITYTVANSPVNKITLGEIEWNTGGPVFDGSAYDYTGVTNANIDTTNFKFTNPEAVSAGDTTLLQANNTLANIAATEKNLYYTYAPVAGVAMDGKITGSYAATGGNLSYTAMKNQATKLTFGNVEWKESGALLARPANITFAGADVDTTHINFTNIQSLDAGRKMTLVSDFGNSVGTITGTKYKVGSTLEGEGKASLVGNDLIFTAETGTTQEQTHNTVMGAEVGMAALSAGNDFVGAATEGLALASNIGADGVSSFAQMGGGTMRQETGSHVDAHTWNAILALGHQNKKERGTFEYGAFFEYGSGNYSTFNGDERGDGSMHYTGGGLLAKYTTKNSVYVESSLRAGTVHDDARNVLRDFRGMPYSYETNANYMGFHLGVGKEIAVAGGNAVDVYGRYFYNRRNGVSFDAGGHYDLDAVTSQVLRVGARYIMKRNKWNFYAGAAYEHEFDGKAGGTADGVAIRGADTSGASFRGEIGATMKPGENSPWSLDLNVSGFAGKKQGFTGGVSVAFMF